MIPAKSFLPKIITQILDKYEDFHSKNEWNEKIQKECLIELDIVFGDVLKQALKIIDEQIITIYTTPDKFKEIAEITVGRKSGHVVKLIPYINYCACEYFLYAVLQTAPTLPSTAAASIRSYDQAYTCEHVLALRLAKLLNSSALRNECVPYETFNILITEIC